MHQSSAVVAEQIVADRLSALLAGLAQSMDYPDLDWLTQEHWSWIKDLLDDLGWQAERQELPDTIDDDFLTALQVEYTRLFINAIPHVVAPPYGSVYLDSEGILYGPSAEKAKQFYHQQGFDLVGPNDIPDHLNHELRFVSLLLQDGRICEAEQFLRQCFHPWFGLFQDRVMGETKQPYYRVMVQLIKFFTKEEEEHDS